MADVTIIYNNNDIATMDASGTKTLKTQGTYVPHDILVKYIKPETVVDTNAIVVEKTFTERLKNGVVMALPENIIAHKDDANFSVLAIVDGSELLAYRSYAIFASNRKIGASATADIHGAYAYLTSPTGIQFGYVCYPPNAADATVVDGKGVAKFYISNNSLYFHENVGAGFDTKTYRFIFSW